MLSSNWRTKDRVMTKVILIVSLDSLCENLHSFLHWHSKQELTALVDVINVPLCVINIFTLANCELHWCLCFLWLLITHVTFYREGLKYSKKRLIGSVGTNIRAHSVLNVFEYRLCNVEYYYVSFVRAQESGYPLFHMT